MQPDDLLEIHQRLSIEDAVKNICIDGEPYTGETGQVSLWAYAVATNYYNVGDKIKYEDFQERVQYAMGLQILENLLEKDLVICFWDPNVEEVMFEYKS